MRCRRLRPKFESLESRDLFAMPADAPPYVPPPPAANDVFVDTVVELESAVRNLQSNQTIVIEPGDYQLTRPLYVGAYGQQLTNVTIRGATEDFNDVVIRGQGMESNAVEFGISIWNAQDVTIANLSVGDVYYHAIDLQGGQGAERVHLYHSRFFDAGEQIVKSNAGGGGVDDSTMEYCVVEYTNGPSVIDHGGGTGYGGALHAHQSDRWVIRNNLFRNSHTPDGVQFIYNPVVLMWNGSSDTIVEGNTFVDCDRAVALGLIDKADGFDHQGGVIRNNFIYQRPGLFSASRRAGSDAQILVYDSPGTQVYHNTVMTNGNSRLSIEVRWATGIPFENNLADAPLGARNGGTYVAAANYLSATPEMFVDPANADFHLLDTAATREAVIDRGVARADATNDFDGDARPLGGAPDIGADEWRSSEPLPNSPPVAADDSAATSEDQPVSIAVLANDADPDGDPLTVSAVTQPTGGAVTIGPGGTVSYAPELGFLGSDSFSYTVSDGRGGTALAQVTVLVTPHYNTVKLEQDPWEPGRQALVVRGTSGDDHIVFRARRGGKSVAVDVNGVTRGQFAASAVSRIVAYGYEGNDTIKVRRALSLKSQLDGGAGNDRLRAGKGSSLLSGAAGDDVLYGGASRDVLLAGLGADLVYGSDRLTRRTDSDLLIAGTTSYDVNDEALAAIMNEWQSGRSYAERTLRLATGLDGLPALGASTVGDDAETDRLFGGMGEDWFFADPARDSTDSKSGERLN